MTGLAEVRERDELRLVVEVEGGYCGKCYGPVLRRSKERRNVIDDHETKERLIHGPAPTARYSHETI